MEINPINNVQPRFDNQKSVENKNKYYDKNVRNLKIQLFAAFSTAYTLDTFDKISDGFNNLTKTQKAGRIAKWAAIISAWSSLMVLLASLTVINSDKNYLSKPKKRLC